MLVYETDPFDSAVTFTSPAALDLSFSTSAHDVDFFVVMYDRDPSGIARAIEGPGKMRMRYMSGWDDPKPLEPGKVYNYSIELRPFAHQFKKGHRLGILLRSEWFPNYERNLNTGERIKDASRIEPATEVIFRNKTHPSKLRNS